MNTARILYPVRVLGPGDRLGIWLCGCSRACPGCSNPELWERRPEYEVSVQSLLQMAEGLARTHPVDGITITGGEPMDQAEELDELLDGLNGITDDILIYSGYRIEELRERKSPQTDGVLSKIAVLIDGEYIENRNTDAVMRGSDNQRIHVLNGKLQAKYEGYLSSAKNQIQNFTARDGVISVGIHRPGFLQDIQGRIKEGGIAE